MNRTVQLEEQRKSLPSYSYKQHIINCIQQNSTLILIGETGSGKSTQIPQYIYESGILNRGMVAITQPRRVAAITLALRVTKERGRDIGELVGYAIRFESAVSRDTKIKYMTEGILLREAITDKYLKQYQVIILDEAHERTVNTDVLFGIVKNVQKARKENNMPELKVIIMSATMDVDHFSKYFDNCPVLYLPGRTYPITIHHTKQKQEDYMFAAIATLFEIHLNAPPQEDVLIFLTGKDEIESMIHQIRTITKSPELQGSMVLRAFPLHSSLPQNKQMDAFTRSAENTRRVVVATNIAETSITLPGIKYVIDTGVVKMKNYEASTGLETLKVTKISQAQAWQRSGRAGRESEGACYRTYTKNELELLEKMTKPEILRCNLSATILQLLAIGVNIENFDLMDKPSKEAISVAFKQLKQLSAIKSTQSPQLTDDGRSMAQLPLDPIYSRMIISAPDYGCINEILDLIAMLSTESVYLEPNQNNRDTAYSQHAKFHMSYGDHFTLLKIYSQFRNASDKKKWCLEHFLSYRNLAYAAEVRKQLADICSQLKILTKTENFDLDKFRKCMIRGLYSNIAEYQARDNNYKVLASHQRAQIHPSSVLSGFHANINGRNSSNGNGLIPVSSKIKNDHNQKPSYVIFNEIVQTSNTYLRTVTRIEPEWIKEVLPNCDFLNRINC
ncbi:ATP-dependent RNA helicase DHX33 [Chironomus tepperi]|uniref:ATP-dependent RNA helicase DHX33 n=1 Tax=Chironomus tepperi TaxID=113505 RepID=UPI00391F1BF7